MTPESSAPPSVDPQVLGKLFVEQYYNHLFDSPSDVHKFYLEDSVLGRPGLDGEMVSVQSLKVKLFSWHSTIVSIIEPNV